MIACQGFCGSGSPDSTRKAFRFLTVVIFSITASLSLLLTAQKDVVIKVIEGAGDVGRPSANLIPSFNRLRDS